MKNYTDTNGIPDKISELSEEERLLIALYRLSSDKSKDDLLSLLENKNRSNKKDKE